ncbi:hypothetical protein [Burkholderia multivorans]|uniref:hypothetical protein n=1 Tax=Burkholderia multivorans TaxID=87883 RepID=UPI0020B36BB9|nr:hypothetical protein [Burkholderia multivorans]
MLEQAAYPECLCGGYWFPHRMGCFYCWHRKDGSDRLPGHPDFWTRDMTQEQHDALVAQHRADLQKADFPFEAAA